jgi:hypothetical protein
LDFTHPSTSIEVREIGKEAISNQAATSRFLVESKSELKPDTPIELINPEYPYTLDLRHYWKAKK